MRYEISPHAVERFQQRSPGSTPWRVRAILQDLAAHGHRQVTSTQTEIHASYQEVPLVLVIKRGAIITVLAERAGG